MIKYILIIAALAILGGCVMNVGTGTIKNEKHPSLDVEFGEDNVEIQDGTQ